MLMRSCTVFSLSVVVVATLAGIGKAQELPSQQQHIQGLEPFMGFWEGELPDTEATVNVWGRWTSNNSFGQFQFSIRGENERTHVGTVIVGYSGENQKVKMWGFWPDEVLEGDVTQLKDGTLTYESAGVNADGTKSSAAVTWKVDGDEVTIHVTNRRRGTSEQPDMHVTLKRSERSRN
jgi:hypothetical protein